MTRSISHYDNIVLKTSEKFDLINEMEGDARTKFKYTIKQGHDKFKSVILNRSIFLNNSYLYIIVVDGEFSIFLVNDKDYPDEYCTDYYLLPNTIVSLDVEQDKEDGKYILYINITPIEKYEKE